VKALYCCPHVSQMGRSRSSPSRGLVGVVNICAVCVCVCKGKCECKF
jgi:hypothetical protein